MQATNDVYHKPRKHSDNMPVGFPESESGAEIRLLRHLFSPREARIALELSALPEPLEKIHKRLGNTGISIGELENDLDGLVKKGAILGGKLFEELGPGKYYSKAMLAIGMYELQGEELTTDFEKDYQEYGKEKFLKEFVTKKTSQMRTIPIHKSVKTDRFVGSYDDIKKLVQNTGGKIGVLKCICRHGKDLTEKPCAHSDIRETCFVLESTASHLLDLGKAVKYRGARHWKFSKLRKPPALSFNRRTTGNRISCVAAAAAAVAAMF